MSEQVPDSPRTEAEIDSMPEDELDALLVKVEEKRARKQAEIAEQPEAIDLFRARMRQVYSPVFEDLREKYAEKGVALEMDADELLGGGNTLKFRFQYGELRLELDGTVMRGGVAFYLIRSTGATQGAVVSGPMLRIRNLSADEFRSFIVEHIRILVKDALRQA